jgi:hypothetical protein
MLYAKAGIPNYWILNLQENCLEAYSLPTESGVYQRREAYTPKEKVGIPGILAGELSLDQLEIAGAPHCTRRVSVGRNAEVTIEP